MKGPNQVAICEHSMQFKTAIPYLILTYRKKKFSHFYKTICDWFLPITRLVFKLSSLSNNHFVGFLRAISSGLLNFLLTRDIRIALQGPKQEAVCEHIMQFETAIPHNFYPTEEKKKKIFRKAKPTILHSMKFCVSSIVFNLLWRDDTFLQNCTFYFAVFIGSIETITLLEIIFSIKCFLSYSFAKNRVKT